MIETYEVDPRKAIEMVGHSKILAFDTETTGLAVTDIVCGWVFANHEASIYIPVRHEGGGNILNVKEFERVLALTFQDRARRGLLVVGHNLGFDLRVSARHGVFPRYPLEDTMINEALISDITHGYTLEVSCERHKVTQKKGGKIYKAIADRFGGAPDRKTMKDFWRMPGDHPDVVEYACGDGISTLELRDAQQPILDSEELRRPWELECKLIHHVAKMHSTGLKLNEAYGEELTKPGGIMAQRLAEAQAQFEPGFNVGSPRQVEGLYRKAGFTDNDFARTEGGKVSFTEYWLKTTDLGQKIIAVRQMRKALSTFALPLTTTHNVNGRVHPVLNQSKSDEYGVVGSRFSCSEPNLQAFPKRNKVIGKLLRELILADEDCELVEADAKQQEPRLYTYFSGDENLYHGYRTDTLDIHDLTAGGLGIDRQFAKTMGLGLLGNMQPKSLSRHLRIPLEEATHFYNKFFEQFPSILRFQQDAKGIFKSTHFVKSILGRKARLDDDRFAYRAVSRIIQNSGGDHIKLCLLRACEYAEACPEVQMLLTIHDSVIYNRRIGFDDKELIAALEHVGEELGIDLPMPFEVGAGRSWRDASYGPEKPGVEAPAGAEAAQLLV